MILECIRLVILSVLVAVVVSQTTPNGNVCNYPATGDESVQKAVPIQDVRNSGLDFVRPQWCITHYSDRKSMKATVLFQPAAKSAPVYNVRHYITRGSKPRMEAELVSGTPLKRRDDDDPFNFCIDDSIDAMVDKVIQQYNDIETMSEALNYYINKPGWAYLLYDMEIPPTIVETLNVKQDMNYCMKSVTKQYADGTYGFFQLFSGLVQTAN